FADDDLSLSGVEPTSVDEIYIWPQFEAGRRHSANGNVGFASVVVARNHNHYDHFAGSQRLAGFVFRDARQVTNRSVSVAQHSALQLRLGALAQHQNVQWVTAADEGLLQSSEQRHDEHGYGHGKGDAERGHHCGTQAETKVADVVSDGNGHSRLLSDMPQAVHNVAL